MAENEDFWIQGAVKRRGALRRTLIEQGLIRPDQKIPVGVLRKAARGTWGEKTAKRAKMALTLRKFHNPVGENPTGGVTLLLVVGAAVLALGGQYAYNRWLAKAGTGVEYMGVDTSGSPEAIETARSACVAKGRGYTFGPLTASGVAAGGATPYVCFPPHYKK